MVVQGGAASGFGTGVRPCGSVSSRLARRCRRLRFPVARRARESRPRPAHVCDRGDNGYEPRAALEEDAHLLPDSAERARAALETDVAGDRCSDSRKRERDGRANAAPARVANGRRRDNHGARPGRFSARGRGKAREIAELGERRRPPVSPGVGRDTLVDHAEASERRLVKPRSEHLVAAARPLQLRRLLQPRLRPVVRPMRRPLEPPRHRA